MQQSTRSISSRILNNSFWFGLETLLETVVFFGTSVAVARYLGPTKLGYFSYINFFVFVVLRTGSTGLASVTRKYMSEYLVEQPGIARAVFYLAFRYQLLGSVLLAGGGIAVTLLFGNPQYRLLSCILIASIVPGVMTVVAAQANNAAEDMRKNAFSAFGYIVSYGTVIVLAVTLRWDLPGVAAAALVGRTVEVILRFPPVFKRLADIPLTPLSPELTRSIRRFCFEAIGIQLLASVVWDRAEFIFLKRFCSLEQIAFYSVSFGLAGNLLLLPRTFAGAAGTTLMVEASRNPKQVKDIVRTLVRILLLVSLPVHLGAAAVTSRAIQVVYGVKYIHAIPVLIIAAVLAIPRAFQEIPDVLLRASNRQRPMLHWLIVTGIINIALDAILIPRYGAVGAAWGNGISQTFGIVALWKLAQRPYSFSFPVQLGLRFLAASSLMAVVAYLTVRAVNGVWGLILAVIVSAPVYLGLVKLFRGFEPSDGDRFALIANRLPMFARGPMLKLIAYMTFAAAQ